VTVKKKVAAMKDARKKCRSRKKVATMRVAQNLLQKQSLPRSRALIPS